MNKLAHLFSTIFLSAVVFIGTFKLAAIGQVHAAPAVVKEARRSLVIESDSPMKFAPAIAVSERITDAPPAPLIVVDDWFSTTVNTLIHNPVGILANDIISNSSQLSITIAKHPRNGTITFDTASAWIIVPSIAITGSSSAIVNGNPAYTEIVEGKVRFVRALDADGSVWGSPVNVDVLASGQFHESSLAIVNGLPAIAYSYGSSHWGPRDIRYAVALDRDGAVWAEHQVVIDADYQIVPTWRSLYVDEIRLREIEGLASLHFRYYETCNKSGCGELQSGRRVMQYKKILGSFDYMPDASYCGVDSFDYYLTNSETVSNRATVSIDIGNSGCNIQTVYLPVLLR